MTTLSNRLTDVMAPLTPGGDPGLAHLSDDELLANTRRLVGRSNQVLATLLVHLAEVEARGAHRTRRCASLYTYCIYELRFSEDAAARRSAAARLVKQFPPLFGAIADGELHLTGLLMIGPHLTPENHAEVLGRAKFRTKKELGKLVRELCPLPQIPDRIEPLGPQLRKTLRNPTWEEYVSARAPRVRELPEGERPRDWASDDDSTTEAVSTESVSNEALPVGPVPRDLAPVTGPQQYQLQFSTTEEHAQLVERAQALLARSRPGLTLGELHLQAMRLLVASLEKRRFGAAVPRGRRQGGERTDQALPQTQELDPSPRQRGESDGGTGDDGPHHSPGPRSRYIPAAVRREVFERDDGRCSYVDERGERCCETCYLELHHLQPFASDGPHLASNLTLRCAAHNALAAEEEFGRQLIAERREATRHQALRHQPL
ncbi:MAG TPA: HNH endonuclease [Polyangiaceae bacterium]|nr:HNH endonuclease [Polyangiaceae bacterium]